ncbi:MAG TPA: SDR family oxidoreductase [Pirellulaceae bacterium]|nr:SDR family oxidoreductase [Pirellulaceae bacterium]
MIMNVAGKAAIITGGGTGVGQATALALAKLGCHVAVNYSRSRDEAEQTAAAIEKLGVRALAIQADVADDAAVRKMVEQAEQAFGRLDMLVNSAGTTRFIPHHDLEQVTADDWNRIMAVNVQGPFNCIRAVQPALLRAGGGEIVSVASVAGIQASGSSIPYCASKAALLNMTVALARVLSPQIRVNAVAPGFITGRWLKQGLGDDAYEKTKQAFEQRLPLGQVCTPEDIATTIVGIITGSDVMTGQTIVVDGGQSIAQWQASIGR